MKGRFTGVQRRIFAGCFVAYMSAYIGRLNLSAALADITASLQITDAQAGLMQTMFALTYAAGQLVNGFLVDRISARKFVCIGLVASAVVNLLFGLANAYWMLPALWMLNGAAQSMLWTPIVKLMSVWYEGEARQRVSFGMSLTLIVGHLAAWGISGYMSACFGWRLSFIIPAVCLALAAVAARLLIMDEPKEAAQARETEKQSPSGAVERMPISVMLFSTGLFCVLLCCVTNGFVRDGIVTWSPSILSSLAGDGGLFQNPIVMSLLIPIINFFGVLVGRFIYGMAHQNARLTVSVMMGAGCLFALLMAPAISSMILCALVLGACCALMSGLNTMLTVLVPMEYDAGRRVGLVAGLVDCFIYLGSSLSGVLSGALSDAAGWRAVFLCWSLVALAGMVLAAFSVRRRPRMGAQAQP